MKVGICWESSKSPGGSRHDGHVMRGPGGGCRDLTTAGEASCGGAKTVNGGRPCGGSHGNRWKWGMDPEVFSSLMEGFPLMS